MILIVKRYCGKISSRVIRDLVCFMPVKAVEQLDRFCSEMRAGAVKRSQPYLMGLKIEEAEKFTPVAKRGAKLKGLAI